MCYQPEEVHKSRMSPLSPGHLEAIKKIVSPGAAQIAEIVYKAWTKSLTPHMPILPMFTAMFEAYQSKDFGVLAKYKLVRIPLSIIGVDQVRYRTPIVSLLHETVLSANMADLSRMYLKNMLKRQNICILFLCSCGVVMGDCKDVIDFYGSEDHQKMDRLRSAIDANGNPVVEVNDFEKIPNNMDLHQNGADLRLLLRVERLTDILAAEIGVVHFSTKWVQETLNSFVGLANPVHHFFSDLPKNQANQITA